MALEVATAFGLGSPIASTPLSGGGPDVVRLTTERGSFVVKPVRRAYEWELYARVADTLDRRGVRQARVVRTTSGGVVSRSGLGVQELLPGEILERPDREQARQVMRQLAAYDEALATIDVPPDLAAEHLWTRVVSPAYLPDHLPALVREVGPPWIDGEAVAEALAVLVEAAPAMAALPRQLVHGDIGPDNVLYDRAAGEVVAVIDFTPFYEPALFSLCGAVYWYHVHPAAGADLSAVEGSVAAYAARRPLSEAERGLVPAMLVREALRRLATPLAGAEEFGTPVREEATRQRYDALLSALTFVRDVGRG